MSRPIVLALVVLSSAACAASDPARAAAPDPKPAKPKLVDCAAATGVRGQKCQVVTCDARYQGFIGTWRGTFHAYVRELSQGDTPVFRTFENTISYAAADCLHAVPDGETFIIGRRVDRFPAEQGLAATTKQGLLVTGRKADDTPFLRTVDDEGTNEYALAFRDNAAGLAVWRLHLAAAPIACATPQNHPCFGPEMTFTTIDAKDPSEPATQRVTVTMALGSPDAPFWEGLVVYGSHARQPSP